MWWEFNTAWTRSKLQTSLRTRRKYRRLPASVQSENVLYKKSHLNDKWNHSQRLSNWICDPLRIAAYANDNVLISVPDFFFKEYDQTTQLLCIHYMVKRQRSVVLIFLLFYSEINVSQHLSVITGDFSVWDFPVTKVRPAHSRF